MQRLNYHIIRKPGFLCRIDSLDFSVVAGNRFRFLGHRLRCSFLRLGKAFHEPRKVFFALRTEDGIEKRRVAQGNIEGSDALDDERLAVLQIYRIAYGIRERRLGCFRSGFMEAVLLNLLVRNIGQLAEIQTLQLVCNELLHRGILPGFQMFAIQIPFQAIIHKVDIHLYGNLIVGDGGIGYADLREVAEIRVVSVLAPAEVVYEAFCLFKRRFLFLLCDALRIRRYLLNERVSLKRSRINKLSVHNAALGKRLADGDGIDVIQIVTLPVGVEIVRFNELGDSSLYLCPRQFRKLRVSGAADKEVLGFIPAVFTGQP